MKVSEATFVRGAVDKEGYPQDGRLEVAFIGRSNVGKSSLLNSLLGKKKLARTSNTPGRTQQINFFLVDQKFYFVDLPGYGYASLSKKQRAELAELIEKYLAQRKELVLTILLIDSRHLPTELDLQVKTWLEHLGRPYLTVLTKSDKLSNNQLRNQISKIKLALATEEVIAYSTLTNFGKDSLWKAILARLSDEKL
ncbi:MAG: YihA family ribosome biogenesis GTP-binding protein [Blastocatellia bacterium]|nr:YihA family ribosome biogenesis GTP-binding protein [Blastocatellia bacterium]MBL8196328.1 YihA family ribosome biogenesis GTP-binding protein [Blastocatellia bacterium]MBN8722794.1 YihA family ribosome biogenesis GTP-binding protein [Acidobacteriota bacterium]